MSDVTRPTSEFARVQRAVDSPLLWVPLVGLLWFVGDLTGLALGIVLATWHVVAPPAPRTLVLASVVAAALVPLAWLGGGLPGSGEIGPGVVLRSLLPHRLAFTAVVLATVGVARDVLGTPVPSRVPDGPRPSEDPTSRLAEVDLLKAAGIVVVVLIHALPPRWAPDIGPVELWLADATRFAVPAFLFASGWLYGTATTTRGATARRLRRLLVPYAIASVAAVALRLAVPTLGRVSDPLVEILTASAFGPYYYVLVIATLVVLLPALRRLPRPVAWGTLLVLLALQWPQEADLVTWPTPFWEARSPLFWGAWFLAGLLLRPHRDRAVVLARGRGAPLLLGMSALGTLGGLAVLPAQSVARLTLAWLGAWVVVALLLVVGLRRPAVPGPVRHLADTTYAIYLWHLFPLLLVQLVLSGVVGIAAGWAVGLAGPLLLVAAVRRSVPDRELRRDLVGA
jgi:surface polysaccharide O-acyltransferase-like enzyme